MLPLRLLLLLRSFLLLRLLLRLLRLRLLLRRALAVLRLMLRLLLLRFRSRPLRLLGFRSWLRSRGFGSQACLVDLLAHALQLRMRAIEAQLVDRAGQQSQRFHMDLKHLADCGHDSLSRPLRIYVAEQTPDRHHAFLDEAFQFVLDAHLAGR